VDPQIHGAIVGGIVSGATVGLALVAELSVSQVRERRADVEASAAELELLVPHVLVPISEMSPTPNLMEGSVRTTWEAQRERVEHLIVMIIRRSRWPMRRARDIRSTARLMYVRFAALVDEAERRQRVAKEAELAEVFTAGLSGLVFGKSEQLHGLIAAEVAKLQRPAGQLPPEQG
jgi:hypothetical protein